MVTKVVKNFLSWSSWISLVFPDDVIFTMIVGAASASSSFILYSWKWLPYGDWMRIALVELRGAGGVV